MSTVLVYLRLMRPANVVTAFADIIAGFVAGCWVATSVPTEIPSTAVLMWLLLATLGLYAGGIVFNDVFDAQLDRKERPERPIPSGLISIKQASYFGLGLFSMGIAAAYQVSMASFGLALLICALCLLYNSYSKHHSYLGPVNMGLCRGANLLLGASAVPVALSSIGLLGLIPSLFIAAVTVVSRGEVTGGNKPALYLALGLYALTLVLIAVGLCYLGANAGAALPFLLFFAWQVFRPLNVALQAPTPHLIRQAVKAGVMSLIILDAALTAGFSDWQKGLVVLLLLPVSGWLAKRFAVT